MPYNTASTIPALDQVLCNVWPEIPTDLYQKYSFYLVKAEQERRARWQTFTKLITDTVAWTPNMGQTMRNVIVEDAPLLRQSARPRYISTDPTTDIFMVRERIAEARLQWKEFQSPHFNFLPAFQDFMKGNLVPTRKTIEWQQMAYEDIFYRTCAWDNSPTVYIAGQGPKDAPVGVTASGSDLVSAKTAAWCADQLNLTGGVGFLSAQELFNAASVFAEQVGATPYSGDGMPNGDNQIIDNKFVLVCSNELWMQLTNDPWVKENRPLAMNIVNSAFKGPLWDTIVGKIERWPMRWAVDANLSPSEEEPEVTELNSSAADYGRTKPNPDYTQLSGSPYEIAWLVGGKHYKRISTGPPPEFFAGGVGDPQKVAGMNWNGQVYLTKNFLIPCVDANSAAQVRLNNGRYVRFESTLALGCLPLHPHNMMPIVFRRRRGMTTTEVAQ